ncbi:MAG: type 2 isopentenyl-diphosphate Delta-isomerase [Myxococcales bacterium]|nr:type 2 isopentenyl-diphosphate Delta-isomerase [Myxococcales bacterium]
MASSGIEKRKADHIEVAASGRADFVAQGTLLSSVQLVHQSLPEIAESEIDLSVSFLGKTLRAPLLITGMTGGTEEAAAINRDLAAVAQEMGVGFGLGSQRAMAENPELASTYQIRDAAPEALIIGNIGAVQAKDYGVARIRELADAVGADAMAVHLNPAQEMIQSGGDRDFRGVLETIGELVADLGIPLIAKETGCGISPRAARTLYRAGVKFVDVSGAGGTSWTAVERHRAAENSVQQRLGDEFWDWGIPTAASVHACAQAGLEVVASGGVRTGLDIARAMALGASVGGMAAPVLRAQQSGGQDAAAALVQSLIDSIRTTLLLTGCQSVLDLHEAPRCISAPLRSWIDALI